MENKEGGILRSTHASLAYLFGPLGFITGVAIFFLKRDDEYVRFHAIQAVGFSLLWLGGWIALAMIPFGALLALFPIWGLIMFSFWLVLLVKGYQGEKFILPFVGNSIQRFGSKFGTS